MADLIDRETVRLAYEKSFENDNHKIAGASAIHRQEHRHILHILDKIPAIDSESLRPQGEWKDIHGGKYATPRYVCSNCGEKALYKFEKDDFDRTIAVPALSKSCPNCGAKMEVTNG